MSTTEGEAPGPPAAADTDPRWWRVVQFLCGFVLGYPTILGAAELAALAPQIAGWLLLASVPLFVGYLLWRSGWKPVAAGVWIGGYTQLAFIVWLTSQVVPNWAD